VRFRQNQMPQVKKTKAAHSRKVSDNDPRGDQLQPLRRGHDLRPGGKLLVRRPPARSDAYCRHGLPLPDLSRKTSEIAERSN
jgi:hypothetical protein